MSEYIFEYVLVGILGLLSIFSFLIGFEQMIRVVISSYIVSAISLFLSNSIGLLISYLQLNPEQTFIGLSFNSWASFFTNGQTTMILLLYGVLLLLIFRHSKINITLPDNDLVTNTIQAILIPLTVFSILFGLEIAILGDKVMSSFYMERIASEISENINAQRAITLTPLRITIHALITLRITTQVGIGINKGGSHIAYE